MGPGSQPGSDIIQKPPPPWTEWQTRVKPLLPFPKLHLRAVNICIINLRNKTIYNPSFDLTPPRYTFTLDLTSSIFQRFLQQVATLKWFWQSNRMKWVRPQIYCFSIFVGSFFYSSIRCVRVCRGGKYQLSFVWRIHRVEEKKLFRQTNTKVIAFSINNFASGAQSSSVCESPGETQSKILQQETVCNFSPMLTMFFSFYCQFNEHYFLFENSLLSAKSCLRPPPVFWP